MWLCTIWIGGDENITEMEKKIILFTMTFLGFLCEFAEKKDEKKNEMRVNKPVFLRSFWQMVLNKPNRS